MDLRTKRGKFEAFLQRRLNNATHFLHLHKEQILEQTAKSPILVVQSRFQQSTGEFLVESPPVQKKS